MKYIKLSRYIKDSKNKEFLVTPYQFGDTEYYGEYGMQDKPSTIFKSIYLVEITKYRIDYHNHNFKTVNHLCPDAIVRLHDKKIANEIFYYLTHTNLTFEDAVKYLSNRKDTISFKTYNMED